MNYIVYKTTNLINSKVYYGVHRTNLEVFDGYIGCGVAPGRQLKGKLKGFPAAVKKYGYANFRRETLAVFPDTDEGKEAAYALEAKIVDTNCVKSSKTYNLTRGGKFTIGEKNKKPINQYKLDGTFIRTWDSITEAEQSLNICNISQCLTGKSKIAGNYQWRYYKGTSNIDPVDPKEKSVYQFDLLGNLLKCWKSAAEASLTFKNASAAKSAISQVCLKKAHQAYGYFWSFKCQFDYDPFKNGVAIAKYNDAGQFIESYTSINEAARQNNIKTSANIIAAIKGKQKRCGGFRWRYFDGNTANIKPLR